MILTTLLASMALAAEGEVPSPPAEEVVKSSSVSGPETEVGGVFAPAIMPRGSMALYGLLGAPDVGGGFRQGFEWAELEVRLWLNYLQAAATLEVGGKLSIYKRGILELAANAAVGVEGNSGSRYFDKVNFGYVAIRPRAA